LGYGFQLTAMRNTNTPYAAYSNLGSNVKQKLLTSGSQAGRTYLEQNGVLNNNTFTFQWTAPAQGTGNINFYAAGIACNSNGGSSGDRAGNTTLILPEAPQLSVLTDVSQPSCNGQNNGMVVVSVPTGVPPYSFEWSDDSIDQNRTNLTPGTYTLLVTDDLNQTLETSIEIMEPLALSSFINVIQPTLFGGDGEISVAISGGTPPYSMSVNEMISPLSFSADQGVYFVEIEDANGCQSSANFEVVAPLPFQILTSTQEPTCYGSDDGTISLSISGAFAPYTVSWNNDLSGTELSGLGSGIYTANIVDQYGNTSIEVVELSQPSALELILDYEPILCFGDLTTIDIQAIGGTAPYSGTGALFISAGEETLAIQDANGCQTTQTITIDAPPLFSGTEINAEMSCNDGAIEVEIAASGGTAPLTGVGIQVISSPGSFVFPLLDANGCASEAIVNVIAIDGPLITSETQQINCAEACTGAIALFTENTNGIFLWSDGFEGAIRTELCAGPYSCQFIGDDGCVVINEFNLTAPAPMNLLLNYSENVCPGLTAEVTLSVSGGIAPYEILWDGIEGSTFQEFGAGTFELLVSDFLGCTTDTTLTIASFPALEVVDPLIDQISCFGSSTGGITVNTSPNFSTIEYIWTPNVSNGQSAENLASGIYDVVLIDQDGCAYEVSYTLIEPSPLTAQAIITDNNDGEGNISVDVQGGTTPYAFVWSNGSDGPTIEATTGFYSVTITDDLGCDLTIEGLEITSSVKELGRTSQAAYPNPFDVALQVSITGKYSIYTIFGVLYYSGIGTGVIDTNSWPCGVYMVIDENNHIERIMKR
jgi:SprB repeat